VLRAYVCRRYTWSRWTGTKQHVFISWIFYWAMWRSIPLITLQPRQPYIIYTSHIVRESMPVARSPTNP
jgi:hypothetical protein